MIIKTALSLLTFGRYNFGSASTEVMFKKKELNIDC